jgi:iron(III) transport system permease protein
MLTFKTVATTEFVTIALQSFGIAFVGSLLTVMVALAIIYLPKWNPINWLRKSARIATIGYAIPGAVLAIGVMIPMIALDKWIINFLKNNFDIVSGFIINGTVIALVYAYVIRFLAVAFNPLSSNQLKIGEALSESSRILGKGRFTTFVKIDLLLLKPAMIGAFILVFIDIMKELPLTLILKPYDVQTLAVKAYEYASDELILEASLPALCIVLTGIVPVFLLNRFILDDRKQVED